MSPDVSCGRDVVAVAGVSGSVRSGLARLRRLPVRERLATLHLLALAGLVEVGVRLVPLPRLARSLGLALGADRVAPPAGARVLNGAGLTARERRQVRAVRRLMSRWSLAPGPCLREALLLGHVLRRHGPVLRLGVAHVGGALAGHAWVEVRGAVVGGSDPFLPLSGSADGSPA